MTKETAKKTTVTAKSAEPAKKSGTAAKTEPAKSAEVKKTEPVKKVEVKKEESVKKAEPAKKTEAAKKAEPVKKTEAAKKAEPAKKTEAAKKAEPAKKEPAKKAASAKKAEVKTNFVIQSYGKEISEKEIVALGKKAWSAAGNKIREIKTLTAYVQPENGKVYFVINGIALEGDGSDF